MLRAVVILLLLAAVLYAAFWILDKRGRKGPGSGGGGGGSRPIKPGPVGPDDDEDFLRKLEWERRRHNRQGPDPDKPEETK